MHLRAITWLYLRCVGAVIRKLKMHRYDTILTQTAGSGVVAMGRPLSLWRTAQCFHVNVWSQRRQKDYNSDKLIIYIWNNFEKEEELNYLKLTSVDIPHNARGEHFCFHFLSPRYPEDKPEVTLDHQWAHITALDVLGSRLSLCTLQSTQWLDW